MIDEKDQAKIKAGDKLIKTSGYSSWNYIEVTVLRVTKTQIILINDLKYRKDGTSFDTWSNSRLLYPTPELMAHIKETQEKEKARNIINRASFDHMPLDKLKRIAAIIQEGK